MNLIEQIVSELAGAIVLPDIGQCDYCGHLPARTIRGREHLGPMCSVCTSNYFLSFRATNSQRRHQ